MTGLGLSGLLVALALLGPSCGDSETGGVTPPDDDLLPDFTLLDVNQNSPTHGEWVSLSDFGDQILIIYFLPSPACPTCRAHLAGLETLVDSLHGLGMPDVAGMSINLPHYANEIEHLWEDMTTFLPVLQDTMGTIGDEQGPAVGLLLDCVQFDVLLLIDRDRTPGRKTRSCSRCEVSLKEGAGRARIADWVFELDSTGVITAK
jgi:hypothetical protein